MYTAKAEMIEQLKTILGETVTDDRMALILDLTGQKVLTELNQPVLPVALEAVVVEMAADAYWMNQSAAGTAEGEVQSISDNGQTVSYRASSYQAVLQAAAKSLKDYGAQLDTYRKPRW